MIRVAYIISSGGANWNLWGMIQQMERHNLELIPVFLDSGAGQLARMLSTSKRRFVSLDIANPRNLARTASRISGVIAALHPDLVHSNLFIPALSTEIARMYWPRRVPSVVHRHHNAQHHLDGKRLHVRADAFTARHATRVIAVSGPVKQTLVDREGIKADKITVVHNGFDWETLLARALDWRPIANSPHLAEPDRPYVAAVGRLDPIKDIPTVLEAFRMIAADWPSLDLRIAGSGDWRYERYLREMAQSLRIAHRTHFLGHIENAPGLVYNSQCFVQASLDEACSQTILEAIGVGTPTVTTTSGGTSEIVDGILEPLNVRDPAAMAERLDGILRDVDRARLKAQRGAAIVRRKFSIERQMEQCASVYRQALHSGA